MTEEELSWKEQEDIRKLCVIPTSVAFVAIVAYFIYLMHSNALTTAWDFLFRIVLLFTTLPPTIFIATYEVLYSRKVRKNLKFHVKRFAGRLLIILLGVLSFFMSLALSYLALSPLIGDRALLPGIILWMVGVFIAGIRFSEFFGRFEKGEW